MAEKKKEPDDSKDSWKPIRRGHVRGEMQRAGAWANVTHKGTVTCGVEVTRMFDKMALVRGLQPRMGYKLEFVVNEGRAQVGIYPIASATMTTTEIRRYETKGSSTVRFLMSGVFLDHPDLAPIGTVRCTAGTDTAPDGFPMVTIAPLSGVTNFTGSRSPSGQSKSDKSKPNQSKPDRPKPDQAADSTDP